MSWPCRDEITGHNTGISVMYSVVLMFDVTFPDVAMGSIGRGPSLAFLAGVIATSFVMVQFSGWDDNV